jgi:hypothetical protein
MVIPASAHREFAVEHSTSKCIDMKDLTGNAKDAYRKLVVRQ